MQITQGNRDGANVNDLSASMKSSRCLFGIHLRVRHGHGQFCSDEILFVKATYISLMIRIRRVQLYSASRFLVAVRNMKNRT